MRSSLILKFRFLFPELKKEYIFKDTPESYIQAKQIFDEHFIRTSKYRRSYRNAKKYIENTIGPFKSAWVLPQYLIYNDAGFLSGQLMTSNLCPNPDTKILLKNVALRSIPYGSFLAKMIEYEPNQFSIIVYTGTMDFFGNLACLMFAIKDQNENGHDYGLDCQELVDRFWGLALIFFDNGFKSENFTLLYPHFRYKELNELDESNARLLCGSALEFCGYHEFGHIADMNSGAFSDTVKDEYSADFFAISAIVGRLNENNNINPYDKLFNPDLMRLSIIGCIFALESIQFIVNSFSGKKYAFLGKEQQFPTNSGSHPNIELRLKNLYANLPQKIQGLLNQDKLYITIKETFETYSPIIKNDEYEPSSAFWNRLEDISISKKDLKEMNAEEMGYLLKQIILKQTKEDSHSHN